MSENFPYRNLHDYLDIIFRDKVPTENEIIQAKKHYWKTYNTHLKRNQRRKHKEITISLSKEELELLSRRLEPQQSVSQYIKSVLHQHLSNNEPIISSQHKDLMQIEQQLFILIDYLESLIYQRRFVDNTQIGKLEQHFRYLQHVLETQF